MRGPTLCLLAALGLAGPAWAEPPHVEDAAADDDVAEIEELIARMRARLQALGQATDQRDQSLEFLTKQVEQAIGDIAVQQDEKAGLMQQNADLNWRVESLVESRGALKEELLETSSQHESSVADLEAELADLSQLLSLETEAKAALLGAKDDLVVQLETARKEQASLAQARREQQREIAQLNQQVAALRSELNTVSGALATSKERIAKKERDLAALQDRLDLALATRVEKLSPYRTEFFSRLSGAVGAHPDMRVEGERFVFQSEVLFESGSAEIGEAGKRQLVELARSLHIISRDIPSEIDWVLRVDGHTDRRPIANADFPSNWELSTARAIAVVRFLIRQGVPPYRLAAAGFGEFQPLDAGDDEIAYRRNRRIEFKLSRK
jgi:chemotaxis protein MotB